MVVEGMVEIRSRSSMLNQSAETERPLILRGDQTTPAVQLRDSEGFRSAFEPERERYWREPEATPAASSPGPPLEGGRLRRI